MSVTLENPFPDPTPEEDPSQLKKVKLFNENTFDFDIAKLQRLLARRFPIPAHLRYGPKALLCPVLSKNSFNVYTKGVDPDKIPRNVCFMGMCPMVSLRLPQAVPMMNQLRVGIGAQCEVDLDKFGHCNNVCVEYATILQDDATGAFELINYSPKGVHVDDILYCNDHTVNVRPKTPNYPQQLPLLPEIPENYVFYRVKCRCKFDQTNVVLEQSAILSNGSTIKFGCMKFVFLILHQ